MIAQATVATVNTRRGRAASRPIASIIGHQEAKTQDARARIRAALPGYAHHIASADWARSLVVSWDAARFEAVPTADWVADVFGPTLPKSVVVDELGISWLVTDAVAGITPGRGWVLLQLREKAGGESVWLLNGHPVNSAFSKKPVPKRKIGGVWVGTKTWRREQWARELAVAVRIVQAVTSAGRELVAVADWNRATVTVPGLENTRQGPVPRGVDAYDQIFTTPGLRGRGFTAAPANGSDHKPRVATIGNKEEGPVAPSNPTVKKRGVDSDGRPILASDELWGRWEYLVFVLGFRPTIVQGSWMSRAGGGAEQSAGYHDFGGALDIRTKDLTDAQIDRLVFEARKLGFDAWRRNPSLPGGFAEHVHMGLHTDLPTHPGIQDQHRDYLAGGNGLTGSSHAPDHERRPSPLITTPPKGAFMPTAKEIWDEPIALTDGSGKTLPARTVLAMTQKRAGDTRKLAAELQKNGVAADVSLDDLETAIRKVLGSLDNTPVVTP